MPPNVTRPCAFVFLRADDRVLVSEMHDAVEGIFYRPAGGGIEFRETSEVAARRELQEELGIAVDELGLLGVRGEIFVEIARVVDVADLRAGRFLPLYPDGVLELLS